MPPISEVHMLPVKYPIWRRRELGWFYFLSTLSVLVSCSLNFTTFIIFLTLSLLRLKLKLMRTHLKCFKNYLPINFHGWLFRGSELMLFWYLGDCPKRYQLTRSYWHGSIGLSIIISVGDSSDNTLPSSIHLSPCFTLTFLAGLSYRLLTISIVYQLYPWTTRYYHPSSRLQHPFFLLQICPTLFSQTPTSEPL